MKRKIIFISSCSHPVLSKANGKNIKWRISNDWFSNEAKFFKKYYPNLDIECWTYEREFKKKEELFIDGIKYKVFPLTFYLRIGMEYSIQMIKEFIKEQKKYRDTKIIFHIHSYHTWQTYLMLLFLKKENNIKIIAQHHGGRSPFKNLKKYKKLIFGLPLILLMQLAENLLYKKIDIFYALSDEEIDYLKKISRKSKIKFQTMGIGEEYFKKMDKIKSRKKLGLYLNKKYFLFIGRVTKNKGIKELISAVKEIKENIELLIIGEETNKKEYSTYVRNKNIKNIKFLGTIYGNEKLLYLSACDYLILSSYTEGAPVVIMEAIAKNLPVIATDVGGVRKIIENYKEGIIIKPKSSAEIFRAIKEILEWHKKDISKYAKKYKWEEIIHSTYRDYD